jgi:hypothetical protein
MCLNEIYSKVHIVKHLSYIFSIQNDLKKDIFFAIPFQLCYRIHHWQGPGKAGGTQIKWDTSAAGLC